MAPIEALRDDRRRPARHTRSAASCSASLTGARRRGFIAQGLSGAGAGAVGLGALGVFVGVAMLGPVIARRFVRIVGWPLPAAPWHGGHAGPGERHAQPAAHGGDLVGADDRRRPGRLHHGVRGVGQGVDVDVGRQGDEERLDRHDAVRHGRVEPVGGAARSTTLPETGAVTPLRYFDAKVDGSTTQASAVDPATYRAERCARPSCRRAWPTSVRTTSRCRPKTATSKNLHVGDTVTMFFPETGDQQLKVVARVRHRRNRSATTPSRRRRSTRTSRRTSTTTSS